MNRLDYVVLIATILAIPLYGLWRTRGRETLGHYIKGDESIRWATIGLSVLATQAGPITFLSMIVVPMTSEVIVSHCEMRLG